MANSCQNKTTCCTDSSACNQYGFPDKALIATHSYDHTDTAIAPFAAVQGRIDNDQPVGVRVKWTGAGAHVMVISGYSANGQEKIAVQDPWYGKSLIFYSSFPSQYQSGGKWTHTYYTQKQ